jgi:hypothetical protein
MYEVNEVVAFRTPNGDYDEGIVLEIDKHSMVVLSGRTLGPTQIYNHQILPLLAFIACRESWKVRQRKTKKGRMNQLAKSLGKDSTLSDTIFRCFFDNN